MGGDLFLWELARVAGLAAYMALALSLLSGLGMRLGLFGRLATNRAVRSLHEYAAVLWIPLGLLHVGSLLLDRTARIGVLDLVVPFVAPYGRLPIGLGTISLLLVAVVAVTGWLKPWLPGAAWQWVHRSSYVAYGLLFAHALLAGTDFSDPIVSSVTWGTAAVLGLLAASRLVWGRLAA
jgi:sulfoxide reductase heme-binding subunit YedZ